MGRDREAVVHEVGVPTAERRKGDVPIIVEIEEAALLALSL